MKSRWLLNLALLALVIVLGHFIYNTGDNDAVQLSDLDKDSVESIEIRHRDRYTVLKRQHGRWRMTRPINVEANAFRIDSVLNLVNTVSAAQYPAADMDLSRFDLDQPRTSIRFHDGDRDIKFDFGSANPINRMRYVRVDDTVHLIADHLYPLVSSQLGTLVSNRLFADGIEITSLQIPGYRFTRQDQGWQMLPDNPEMDSDDINAIIDNWEHAQAFGVHDYLERGRLGEIEVSYSASGVSVTERFTVTDTDPWLIIAHPGLGIEYHLDSSNYDRLFNPSSDSERALLDAEESRLSR